jgi:hypothetical protein
VARKLHRVANIPDEFTLEESHRLDSQPARLVWLYQFEQALQRGGTPEHEQRAAQAVDTLFTHFYSGWSVKNGSGSSLPRGDSDARPISGYVRSACPLIRNRKLFSGNPWGGERWSHHQGRLR